MKTTVEIVNGKVVLTSPKESQIINYCNHLTTYEVSAMFLRESVSGSKRSRIQAYRRIGDALGCSLAMLTKMINGAIYKCYIEPMKTIHDRLSVQAIAMEVFKRDGSTKRVVCRQRVYNTVNLINDNADAIKHFINNGLSNMVAFAVLLGRHAEEVMGQAWPICLRNSTTRNDKIVKACIRLREEHGIRLDYVNAILFLSTLPTTLLEMNTYALAALYDATLRAECPGMVASIVHKYHKRYCALDFKKWSYKHVTKNPSPLISFAKNIARLHKIAVFLGKEVTVGTLVEKAPIRAFRGLYY